MEHTKDELLEFWFGKDRDDAVVARAKAGLWWGHDPASDELLQERFGAATSAAAAGVLDHWVGSPRGRLALILLLDQLPRAVYRGTPAAFATDERALGVASKGLASGADRLLRRARHIAYFRKAGKPGQARQIVAGLLAEGVVEFAMEYPVTTEIPLDDPAYNLALGPFYADCARHLHQLHCVLPAGVGRTRLLYRMGMDFWGWSARLPGVSSFGGTSRAGSWARTWSWWPASRTAWSGAATCGAGPCLTTSWLSARGGGAMRRGRARRPRSRRRGRAGG
jgi:hypothetical protein